MRLQINYRSIELDATKFLPNDLDEYSKEFEFGNRYSAYTIDKDFEIIKCIGYIVRIGYGIDFRVEDLNGRIISNNQWFTTMVGEAKLIQREIINHCRTEVDENIQKLSRYAW